MSASNPVTRFLEAHPHVTRIEAFLIDVNGIARGKWLPRDRIAALEAKGLAMPRSVFALDIWGRDVAAAGLAFGTGDPDGACHPIEGRLAATPWIDGRSAQLMLAMREPDGSHPAADPRGVLARVVDAFEARGLSPVVATELEFYLHRTDAAGRPVPPGATHRYDTLAIEALHEHAALFDALEAACHAQGLPADTLLSEAGPGQFELNLVHRADALAAADDAILLKRIVKAVARNHGLDATFMAKPYGDASGNGMHIHVSLPDASSTNIFADSSGAPSEPLLHAVTGLLQTLPEAMLAFAPHANSYRRFQSDAHAPTIATWGVDDRSAAVRVVVADAHSTRLEHRVAGADCNPYLAVAAVLAGMLEGLDAAVSPPPPQDRVAADVGLRLPGDWGAAIDAFAVSPFVARWFGVRFRDIFVACKRQDRDTLLAQVSDVEYASYLKAL